MEHPNEVDKEFEAFTEEQIKKVEDYMEKYQLLNALQEIWAVISRTNKYIDETRPWELAEKWRNRKIKIKYVSFNRKYQKNRNSFITIYGRNSTENLLHQIGVKEELQTWESLY